MGGVGREGRPRQHKTAQLHHRNLSWDDTLRPEAVHGTNVGRAPYAGEALQWCRNDRQILPGIPTSKNNNNNNCDVSNTHFTLLPYFHNFNVMSIARLFWIFSRRLCKSVSQPLGPSVGPSVGQLVGQSLSCSVKSLAFTYLLKRSLSSRSRS